MDDPQDLLQRRRIWGVPPDAVAMWVAACQREQTELRAQLATLETRLAQMAVERDAANVAVAALKDNLTRLEAEKAEWKGRPETIRAEAIQFVVDAYAEAQQARAQLAQEIALEEATAREAMEAERAATREEIAAMRRALDAERRQHEEAVAALQQQRVEALASLNTLSRSLLAQLGRIEAIAPDTAAPSSMHSSETSEEIAEEIAPETPTPMDVVTEQPGWTASPARMESPSDEAMANPPQAAPSEDTMLTRALDELEAILRGNRKAGPEN